MSQLMLFQNVILMSALLRDFGLFTYFDPIVTIPCWNPFTVSDTEENAISPSFL